MIDLKKIFTEHFEEIQYILHEDDSYVEKTLPVLDFIQLLIQHIPEKYFKMTRYYGLYARRRELDKTIRKAVDPCKHKIILDWNQWLGIVIL
nr:transposase [Schaedlerella arabinosiphila]